MLTCKTLFEKDEDIRIYDIENVYIATGTRWMLKAKTKKKLSEMNNIDRYRKNRNCL